MIALVTDSNAQLPLSLRERYGVRVVPLTIVVDGAAYREGVDITTGEFYERLEAGAMVKTAAPAPGTVLGVFEEAVAAGADRILAVHIGSNVSGTLNAVHVASRGVPVPVDVVDTGTAAFAVACCVWAAGEALAAGGDAAEAAGAAKRVAGEVGNVFVAGALDLARRGGRLAPDVVAGPAAGVPVLALEGGVMREIAHADDVEAAVEAMSRYVAGFAPGRALRVGLGDALAPDLVAELEADLAPLGLVEEIVRYEIGPSVGAHTGPGTVGAVFYPAGEPGS